MHVTNGLVIQFKSPTTANSEVVPKRIIGRRRSFLPIEENMCKNHNGMANEDDESDDDNRDDDYYNESETSDDENDNDDDITLIGQIFPQI